MRRDVEPHSRRVKARSTVAMGVMIISGKALIRKEENVSIQGLFPTELLLSREALEIRELP